MDLFGSLVEIPRKNKSILVITDRFTNLVRLVPLGSTTAFHIAKAFAKDWVFTYGPPLTVLTDNGPQFAAKFLLQIYRVLGISEVFTTTYHPETNGQTERYNRAILSALRKFCGDQSTSWDLYLDILAYS